MKFFVAVVAAMLVLTAQDAFGMGRPTNNYSLPFNFYNDIRETDIVLPAHVFWTWDDTLHCVQETDSEFQPNGGFSSPCPEGPPGSADVLIEPDPSLTPGTTIYYRCGIHTAFMRGKLNIKEPCFDAGPCPPGSHPDPDFDCECLEESIVVPMAINIRRGRLLRGSLSDLFEIESTPRTPEIPENGTFGIAEENGKAAVAFKFHLNDLGGSLPDRLLKLQIRWHGPYRPDAKILWFLRDGNLSTVSSSRNLHRLGRNGHRDRRHQNPNEWHPFALGVKNLLEFPIGDHELFDSDGVMTIIMKLKVPPSFNGDPEDVELYLDIVRLLVKRSVLQQ